MIEPARLSAAVLRWQLQGPQPDLVEDSRNQETGTSAAAVTSTHLRALATIVARDGRAGNLQPDGLTASWPSVRFRGLRLVSRRKKGARTWADQLGLRWPCTGWAGGESPGRCAGERSPLGEQRAHAGAPSRARLLRRFLDRDLHARGDEGAPPAGQAVRRPRVTGRPERQLFSERARLHRAPDRAGERGSGAGT